MDARYQTPLMRAIAARLTYCARLDALNRAITMSEDTAPHTSYEVSLYYRRDVN